MIIKRKASVISDLTAHREPVPILIRAFRLLSLRTCTKTLSFFKTGLCYLYFGNVYFT